MSRPVWRWRMRAPRFAASASYGINTFTFENTRDIALHNWNAGVSLTWNLFDGFGSGSRVASLRSQVTQNDWEQNEYESTLEVTLRNATAELGGGAYRNRGSDARAGRGRGSGTGRYGRTRGRSRDALSRHGDGPGPAGKWNSRGRSTPTMR